VALTHDVQKMNNGFAGVTPEWTVDNLDQIMSYYLSTGKSLLSPYPKDYEENLRWRLKINRQCKTDSLYRAKVKKLFHLDPLFAFNAFFYTLDVRRRPRHHRPFTTYPYQDLMILTKCDHIERGEDLADEKSRDMGASWIGIAVYAWFWLKPEGGYDFLLGSRIQDYVDKKGDMRTLFEKFRYLLYRLPPWLLPVGFNSKKHDNYMKLINPESFSSITGESNNANFSTGGRYRSIFMDEFAKWKDTDVAAWTATADATPCRMPVSTPFGAFGQYFNTISDGKTKKLTIHWSLHPLKGEGLYCPWPKPVDMTEGKVANWLSWKGEKAWLRSPWYDKECQRRDAKTVAQELDIDYIGAGSPVFVGAAASRMMTLLRSKKEPQELWEYQFGSEKFEKLSESPRDLESLLIVYSLPTKRTTELVGVDVVEGREEGDFAVIKGLCRETKSCSFTLYTRSDEVVLAKMILWINEWLMSTKANPETSPWWVIETIGPGLSTFDLCVEWGMTNLFMMPQYDSARECIFHQKGWRTTSSSRRKLVGCVKRWLNEGVGWVDTRCVGEMTSFTYSSANRPEAAGGAHDDEVMAWGMALAADEIMPGGEYKAPVIRRPDGLPDNIFHIDDYRNPDEETSIESRCWATAQQMREANNLSSDVRNSNKDWKEGL
jgi:hypothetical protein